MLFLLATLASAQEVGAILRPDFEIDLAADREGEDAVAARTRVRAWARGETADGRWFVEVRGVHELLVGSDLEGRFDGEMGETGWEGKVFGPVRLRAGNLVERWGKLDLLPVVDVLNPRDLRYGPIQPQEFQRSPVPMAVVTVGNDVLRSETTVLPFAVHDRIALRGTDWSFLRPGMLEAQRAEIGRCHEDPARDCWGGETVQLLGDNLTQLTGSLGELEPSRRRMMDAALLEKNHPEDSFLHPEIGQRVVVNGPGFDLAVMGAHIHVRQPLAELDPFLADLLQQRRLADQRELPLMLEAAADPIAVSWPRTWVAGVEGSTLLGPIGVRAEGGWQSHEVVRLQWGGAGTSPSVGAGLGLDYIQGSNLAVMVEARWKRLLHVDGDRLQDPPDLDVEDGVAVLYPKRPRERVLFAREDMLQIAGGVRFTTLADRLTVQLGGTYDVVFREYMVQPRLSFRATDGLLLEGGLVLLGGATPPPENLRQAMTFEGGMLSYFGQNDALTLGLVWIL